MIRLARTAATLVAAVAVLAGCGGGPASGAAPVVVPEVVGERPHDASAYTEGLVWDRGRMFESAGRYGRSQLRELDPETGRVLRRRRIPSGYFAEGLAVSGNRLVQLTWRENTAFVWGRDTFAPRGTFTYPGEGWGLTTLGRRLVMSDGSATLRILDPRTFRVVRRVRVRDPGGGVGPLNELEVVRGLVWANVWLSDEILVIDPANGRVRARLDLSGLRSRLPAGGRPEVLNGIAWERSTGDVLVTGKWWPRTFAIRVPDAARP